MVIRADASPQVGSGHLMRTLALADALGATGARVIFASHQLAPGLAERVTAHDHGVASVKGSPGSAEDLAETLEVIAAARAGALVVDHYGVGSGYLEEVARRFPGLVLVAIDDVADRVLPVHLVVNQNPDPPVARYRVLPTTRIIAGPEHAMLRPEFARARAAGILDPAPSVETILVMMGGTDPTNQAAKVLAGLSLIPFRVRVLVVLGPENPHREAISRLLQAAPYRGETCVNVPDVPGLLVQADLVVTPPSVSSLESLCLGRPLVTMTTAQNQGGNGKALAQAGASVDLGWFEAVEPKDVAAAVRALMGDREARRRMSRLGMALVDGMGAQRVAEAIIAAMSEAIKERP
ncbi:MAG: UDP-2,4-diacetamido-2,4,6-trideoxy-beta-L-altropyranose hydrolase [Deltaproteobacteria bacterium]|nr:UDP-2,4-diacetamido-2,4,6-trideoxy-beta-L-altropyranose hydrolase [Deltaproteobacteria bacterium]